MISYYLQIKNDIEKFKLQGLELESQRKTILKELEDKQNRASKDADEYEEKNKAISKILDQLRAGMYESFIQILRWLTMLSAYLFIY